MGRHWDVDLNAWVCQGRLDCPLYENESDQVKCDCTDKCCQTGDDNWINRSEEMICETCMHYVSKSDQKGRCRRHAPSMHGWPVMFPTDWCGDHKLA